MPHPIAWYVIVFALSLIGLPACAQGDDRQTPGLFDSDAVLTIRLTGAIRDLMKDRSDDMQYHHLTLSYHDADSSLVTIPIKAKTRGNFRRTQGGCTYPPLLLNFSESQTPKTSLFGKQNKMKLVTPCSGDRYVVREYLVYKLYNLLTPRSFKARLVKVIFDDTVKQKTSEPRYGILLEEEDQMAKRNHVVIIKDRLVKPEQTQKADFFRMAVFEYLIGNTDWSVQYYQNVKLIASDSLSSPATVPYDFDHAGIVGAPYAKPAEALQLSSTQERRYRGYCVSDMSAFNDTFIQFNGLKKEIYEVYTKCPWIEEGYVKTTTRYLDEFYRTISNPKSVNAEFGYPCNKDGTGNVVIKGLKRK